MLSSSVIGEIVFFSLEQVNKNNKVEITTVEVLNK